MAHEVKDLKRSIAHFGNVLEDNLFFTRNYTRFCQLTAREKEILRLMYEGMTSRQIADKLFISKLTADTHRKKDIPETGSKKFF
ncbi:MAG: helix-turn-helix transcriptional regulator [Cyclobacteriaceae bacterium]